MPASLCLRPFRPIATTLVLLALAACGNEASDEGPRVPVVTGEPLGVAGAHEHGVASLGIAVDGDRVTLDLLVPAASVFGFERAPRSEEERADMEAALARLRSGAGELVAFADPAGCTLESLDRLDAPEIPAVSEAGTDDDTEDHDHDHDHDHSDDDDAHDHGSEDAAGEHGDEADQHGDDEHEDVRLVATLRCTNPPRGTSQLTLTNLLTDLEQVDLTVVTAGGQAAARVAAGASFGL